MNDLGVQLQVMIGPTVPIPVPLPISQAIKRVEVTHDDSQRSGFQIQFQIDRGSPVGMGTQALFNSPLFKVFNRVVLTVTFKGRPHVLMDGVITNQQQTPGSDSTSMVTLTGEDISLMMDQEDRNALHPAQEDTIIVLKLIGSYAQYGLIPVVIPPTFIDPPLPTERIPSQQGTDLEYLQTLAERHGYVFYVAPGPAPLTNKAYWGPPIRAGVPQKALSVNMGAHSNVETLDFQHDALRPELIEGINQDQRTNQSMPVRTFSSTRLPPLASQPTAAVNRQHIRRTQFRESGLSSAQALALAQARMDRSVDEVVSATGEVDAMRYGDVLRTRGLVGLRGAGVLYDGLYYVKRVTHTINKGSYKQRFRLTREGLGTTTPTVRP